MDRHYHIHGRTHYGDEICFGDYTHDLTQALARAHDIQETAFHGLAVTCVVSLPYCLYGPNERYKLGTYCVGRGECDRESVPDR